VVSRHYTLLSAFAALLRATAKPDKVVLITVAKKLTTIAYTVCKSLSSWNSHGRLEIPLPSQKWLRCPIPSIKASELPLLIFDRPPRQICTVRA
jgi:hypothetical protein